MHTATAQRDETGRNGLGDPARPARAAPWRRIRWASSDLYASVSEG